MRVGNFWIYSFSLGVLFTVPPFSAGADGGALLFRSMHALTRAVEFLRENVEKLNLDAIFCIRQVEAQLDSFLTFEGEVFLNLRRWLEVQRDKAKRTAEEGIRIVFAMEPKYAKRVGFLMGEHKKLVWYPSRNTSDDFVEDPVDCPDSYWNMTESDICFSELAGHGHSKDNPCDVSATCVKIKTESRQRDYALTHQVLHWILMEQFGCISGISDTTRLKLCSNVMRDARQIVTNGYPKSHYDLLMEQIGLCGIWGFKDFNNSEWLERILGWQTPSGCYDDHAYYSCIDGTSRVLDRTKREELALSDGCLAHETAVAMLALLASVRFEAEELYSKMNDSPNELDLFLE